MGDGMMEDYTGERRFIHKSVFVLVKLPLWKRLWNVTLGRLVGRYSEWRRVGKVVSVAHDQITVSGPLKKWVT